ncbi:hypothetical protein SDC9_119046 [bioreactor metagenome]|uniref:Uncharacterized protein n=1 Tax=bioreactor metagenome TaxID=1076179 RepID=A0A645C8G9_9ZZZZ
MPGLLQRVDDDLAARAIRDDFKHLARSTLNGVKTPILDLENQGPSSRMDDDEIRPRLLRADWHIPPQQVVIFKLLLQSFGKSALARRHSSGTTSQGRDQHRHSSPPHICMPGTKWALRAVYRSRRRIAN